MSQVASCNYLSLSLSPEKRFNLWELFQLAGWGLTEEKVQSHSLKWTYQKYVSYRECQNLMSSKDYAFLSPDKFCADEVEGLFKIFCFIYASGIKI